MELHDFLSEYYELFAELETNKAQFSEEFYLAARKLLLNQFDAATDIFLQQQALACAESNFELAFKVANYVPRRRLFWWNRKAKALLQQYRAQFELELSALSKGTRDAKADKDVLDTIPGQSSVSAPTTLPVPSTEANAQPPAPPNSP